MHWWIIIDSEHRCFVYFFPNVLPSLLSMWSRESLESLSMAAEDPRAIRVLKAWLLGRDLARMAQPRTEPSTNIVEW